MSLEDSISGLKTQVKGLLDSLIDEKDEAFAEELSEELTKYALVAKTAKTKEAREAAEKNVENILLTMKIRLARKQIKARRGMRDLIPQVVGVVFEVIRTVA